LVLAYDPLKVLGEEGGEIFYITSRPDVETAFGYSLRKIFGEKEGISWEGDYVKWDTIKELKKLESRILNETKKVIMGYPGETTYFESYLSGANQTGMCHLWIYGKGDIYGFADGKRTEALEKFSQYWNEQEKNRWCEIHKFMREFTENKNLKS
jgi:hypothetical protein